MSGNEAADQVVSMSLRGIEVMAKISGEGAKHLAAYLFAVLQGQKQTRGRTRLENLLRSGKELKVFAVRNEDAHLLQGSEALWCPLLRVAGQKECGWSVRCDGARRGRLQD